MSPWALVGQALWAGETVGRPGEDLWEALPAD